MKKILFSWEIGEGLGHLLPHVSLLQELTVQGYQIHLAVQDLRKIITIFKQLPCSYWQAPVRLKPVPHKFQPTFSFTHILHNVGMSDADDLTARLLAWKNLLVAIKPDLIITDYAPALQLAIRGMNLPCLGINNGFCLPALNNPFSTFKIFKSLPPDLDLIRDEAQLTQKINIALKRLQLTQIEAPCDIYQTMNRAFLRTYPEFDPYEKRDDAYYLGIPTPTTQHPLEWPQVAGRKIYAYLKPFMHLEPLLKYLNSLNSAIVISGDSIPARLIKKYSTQSMRILNSPISLQDVADSGDLVITNGTHTTSVFFALKGVPQINIPLNLEQEITSFLIEEQGLGKTVSPRLTVDKFIQEITQNIGNLSDQAALPKLHSMKQKYPNPFQQVYHQPIVEFINQNLT